MIRRTIKIRAQNKYRKTRILMQSTFHTDEFTKDLAEKKTKELHEGICRALADSGFYLSEIETTGL